MTDNNPGRYDRVGQEKIRMVEETCLPGMSVSLLARRHGIAASQSFTWRRLMAQGALTTATADGEVVPASERGRRSRALIIRAGHLSAGREQVIALESLRREHTGLQPIILAEAGLQPIASWIRCHPERSEGSSQSPIGGPRHALR
ncbi:MAG: transposase [Gemmatimonadota bacterium]